MSFDALSAALQRQILVLEHQWDCLPRSARESEKVRSTFASRVQKADALARQIQNLPQRGIVRGIYRDGDYQGREWGTWHPTVPRSDDPILVKQVEVHLEAMPFASAPLELDWDKDDYLRVSLPHGYPRTLHRQYWQDFHGVTLPSWIQVDHMDRKTSDNRLQSLQLLPAWLNQAWRKGASASVPKPARPRKEADAGEARSTDRQSRGEASDCSRLKRRRQT
jgi:hypothetical protein